MPVSAIVKNAVPVTKQSWFDANGSVPAPIAGTMEAIVPAMYQLWGAYGYQPAVTWYQLANMYVSWEYTATEKIARTIASLPPKLFRYENAAGKTLKPYYVKGLLHNDIMTKNYSGEFLARKLKKDHGIKRVEIDDHPFLDLINAPNEDTVRYNFWRMLAIHLELNGAVGIYKAKPDAFGNPQRLHILPATWTGQFKPIPETNGTRLIKGYRLLDQNINTDFTTEEIIWIHYTSLRNPFEGMSALKAQLYAFNMDQYLAQQITAFYKNGAMFSNVFETEQILTQKQYDQVALQLQQYQGAKNAGQKFILHSGLKMAKPLTSTARDAMIDEIERMARDKMLSAHDMSAGKIGLTEHQNRSNLEVVDMGFFNEAIKPRAMLITEYFDQYLVHQYDPALDFEFDYPHFQDRDMDIKERTANLAAGVTTRNEERDKMGLEPVDGGDVILVSPMNVPLSSVANPPEPAPTPAPATGLPPEGEGEGEGSFGKKEFNPDQARNETGKWTAGGGAASTSTKPERERGIAPEEYEKRFGVKPASSNEDLDRFLTDVENTPEYKDVEAKLENLKEGMTLGPVTFWSMQQNQVDGEYTAERKELHEKIMNKVLTDETKAAPGEQPHAILMLGAPASGKSEAGLPIAKELVGKDIKYATMDADYVKKELGSENWNVAAYHEESSDVIEGKNGMIERGGNNRHNMVLDMTGANENKMIRLADELKSKGYAVHVVGVKVDDYQSANRAWSRFRKGGRFVDPHYSSKDVDSRPDKTYGILKKSQSVDSWALVDNRGESKVIDQGKR